MPNVIFIRFKDARRGAENRSSELEKESSVSSGSGGGGMLGDDGDEVIVITYSECGGDKSILVPSSLSSSLSPIQ